MKKIIAALSVFALSVGLSFSQEKSDDSEVRTIKDSEVRSLVKELYKQYNMEDDSFSDDDVKRLVDELKHQLGGNHNEFTDDEVKLLVQTLHETEEKKNHIPTLQEMVAAQKKFGIMFNEGLAWGNLTRIKKQVGRSNFVWNDTMVGLFFEVQSHDLWEPWDWLSVNFMGRTAVYYPYAYTFNKHPQSPKQTLLYNFDFFTAPVVTFNILDVVRINVAPGIHWCYQLTDKWHYWNLGPGIKADVELPLSSRWTLLIGNLFSWDNGNLGTNARMQPLDYVWEYQVQFGCRYSFHKLNKFSFIPYKTPKSKKVINKMKMEVMSDEARAEYKKEMKEKKAADAAARKTSAEKKRPGYAPKTAPAAKKAASASSKAAPAPSSIAHDEAVKNLVDELMTDSTEN